MQTIACTNLRCQVDLIFFTAGFDSENEEYWHHVKEVFAHPEATVMFDNDLALLEMKDPFILGIGNPRIESLCLMNTYDEWPSK